LESLLAEIDLVEVTPDLARAAGEIAERHSLRAYDAMHLASSLSLDEVGLVVVTWDAELRRAVPEAGLTLAA
jgi:predicted nucleic acid-binding protein